MCDPDSPNILEKFREKIRCYAELCVTKNSCIDCRKFWLVSCRVWGRSPPTHVIAHPHKGSFKKKHGNSTEIAQTRQKKIFVRTKTKRRAKPAKFLRARKLARKSKENCTQKVRANNCEARNAETHPAATIARAQSLQKFSKTSLSGVYHQDPVGNPFGAAGRWFKSRAVPVAQHPSQHPPRIGGEGGKRGQRKMTNFERTISSSRSPENLLTFSVAGKKSTR